MQRQRLPKSLVRVRSCESGAAAVEFAIVATVFIFFILGIMELGRALDARNQISRGADAAARTVLVTGSAETAAKAMLTTADPDDLTVVVGTGDVDGVQYRKVTLTYEFRPLLTGIISPMTFTVERWVCPVSDTSCKAP